MGSSVVNLDLLDAATNADDGCHLMPCSIHYFGEAKVSKYLTNAIKKETDGHLTSSFRGRPLAGQKMNLPEDYIGLNIETEVNKSNENIITTWKVKRTFDKFTYWNWDKLPSANDKIQQAFTWFDIANAINGYPTSSAVDGHSNSSK